MMRSLASLLCTAALLAACATAPPDVTPATSLPASTGPQESGATTDHPSASVTVPGASAASATPPDGGHVNLDAHPLVWFTPHPYVRLPDFNKGSTDYFDLFAPDSAWTTAAGRVQVFKLYDGLALGREPTDQELLTVIQGVRQRSLALAFELGPLPHPDGGGSNTDCGRGVEGYSAPFSLDIIRRVVALGGRVDLVAFDEPLAHGHYYDGPNACGWPIEHVASEVFGFVRSLRAIAPDVIVGDIEPAWIQPNIGAAEIGAWLDAYAAVSGERFGFFHLDLDWHRADWPALAVDVERTVRDRGVPSGIIYNGGEDATSNAEWLQLAADRAYQFEQLAGGRPDQVVFQSWHYYPTRVLPETDTAAFTSLVDRYFGERTQIETAGSASVALRTVEGVPIAGAGLAIDAQPLDGPFQVLSLTGSVPQGARTAVVVLRVNSEEAGPGQADFNLYEVGYSETGGANRVANPRFAAGLKGWSPYGAGKANVIPSDRGAGYMLHVRASPVQPLHVDSDAFDVVPGSQFELRLAVSVPLASAQSAYAAVVFLDGTEVQRQMLAVAPLVIDLGMQTTGSDGRVSIDNGGLDPGRYRLHVRYAGDLDYWPSWIDVETQI